MLIVLQIKQVRIGLLVLAGIFGLSAGYFAAQLSGLLLQPPTSNKTLAQMAGGNRDARPTRVDTALILQKNIFDPDARGRGSDIQAEQEAAPATTMASGSLQLLGTVDGGKTPLALIESGGKVIVYRLGASIPGGGELISVTRNEATIRQAGGGELKLTIVKPSLASSRPPTEDATSTGSGIRDLGDNRWAISQDEVEKARSNLNELLKSARLEPNIVNGETEGFVVKMIRPKSLLAQLGLRRGDTVTRVNGVELNSPEKALQIFQQLREAKHLKVDLKRGNENLTYAYDVD